MAYEKTPNWAFAGGGIKEPSARTRRRVYAKLSRLGRRAQAVEIAALDLLGKPPGSQMPAQAGTPPQK